jgi:hypothetical protein
MVAESAREELPHAHLRIALIGRGAETRARRLSGRHMSSARKIIPFVAALLLAAAASGCAPNESGSGSFERNLAVTGPVVLDISNGSGNVEISPGSAGTVHVHAEFRVRTWPWENGKRRAAEITQNPPIEQNGNLIRIGRAQWKHWNIEIQYTIVTPAETELRGTVGSGGLTVRGIRGPARIVSGSGDVTAEQIGEDTQVTAGSGDIRLTDISGEVQATAGSGDLRLSNVRGELRAHTGSGDITVEHPGGAVTTGAGSGDLTVRGASGDVRAHTGSGNVGVDGDPAATSFWDIHTGSGEVTLHVPATASFRLYARSVSGKIETSLPMVVEERAKRDLRARLGDGKARVEVETGSGDISVH